MYLLDMFSLWALGLGLRSAVAVTHVLKFEFRVKLHVKHTSAPPKSTVVSGQTGDARLHTA